MASNNEINVTEIISLFDVKGEIVDSKVITAGNINATYKVTLDDNGVKSSYILQRVNTYVFKDPKSIMSNIDYVTKEILSKAHAGEQTLVFYNTYEGPNYYDDGNGNFYRVCNFIDSVSFDACDDLKVLKALGAAFGDFQNKLSDFDASLLVETIPDFHNTKKRIEKLLNDIEADEYGRVKEVTEEIDFVKSNLELACKLTNMLEAGELPLRVTHNDTKINNVLFDKETLMPIAIIDLDTVMPGLSMHDFGDAVRFACNTALEDEPDFSKVSLDMERFKAFAEGFVGETKDALTKAEIETMVLGAITITIELGVRFLDDYITGDKYFKTLYEGHNLVRARSQFTLAKDMIAKREMMEGFVNSIA